MMMHPDLSAAKSGKEALGLIGTGITVRITFLVVNALGQKALVQNIPMPGFISIDDSIAIDPIGDQ